VFYLKVGGLLLEKFLQTFEGLLGCGNNKQRAKDEVETSQKLYSHKNLFVDLGL